MTACATERLSPRTNVSSGTKNLDTFIFCIFITRSTPHLHYVASGESAGVHITSSVCIGVDRQRLPFFVTFVNTIL